MIRRHQRLQGRPISLWADALCLNQTDVVEKETQVPRMRDIYRGADDVFIMLGYDAKEPGHKSAVDEFFAFADAVVRSRLLDRTFDECLEILKPTRLGVVPDPKDFLHRLLYCSRAVLFGTQWFKRVWVTQEAALNPRGPIVFYHEIWTGWQPGQQLPPMIGTGLSFAGIVLAFRILFNHSGPSTRSEIQFLSDTSLPLILSQRTRKIEDDIEDPGADVEVQPPVGGQRTSDTRRKEHQRLTRRLWIILSQGCGEATVAHDHIYGYLGLASIPSLPQALRPNYSVPFSQAFKEYGAFCMENTGWMFNKIGSSKHLEGCPSWVPDFRVRGSDMLSPPTRANISISPDRRRLTTQGVILCSAQTHIDIASSVAPRLYGCASHIVGAAKLALEAWLEATGLEPDDRNAAIIAFLRPIESSQGKIPANALFYSTLEMWADAPAGSVVQELLQRPLFESLRGESVIEQAIAHFMTAFNGSGPERPLMVANVAHFLLTSAFFVARGVGIIPADDGYSEDGAHLDRHSSARYIVNFDRKLCIPDPRTDVVAVFKDRTAPFLLRRRGQQHEILTTCHAVQIDKSTERGVQLPTRGVLNEEFFANREVVDFTLV